MNESDINEVNMGKKYERKCPCGSGKYYKDCCNVIVDGETPNEIKNIIRNSVIQSFDKAHCVRGEHCIYSANLVKDLLLMFGIRSYVAAGSAKWNNYPTWFQWRPQDRLMQYHAWTVTQYGETVDLACDSMRQRQDGGGSLVTKYNIPSPKYCWCKNPNDREYIIHDLGAKNIKMSENGYKILRDIAFNAKVSNIEI